MAATPPTGKPYPWCASGIASAASTTPGSVATFCTCSSEPSRAIASKSCSSANTRAGTRMSGRDSAGISQVVSSSRIASDIQHHARAPPGAVGLEQRPVQGDGLDEMRRIAGMPVQRRRELARAQVERRRPLGNERLRLGEERELVQPADEQRRAIGTGDTDAERCRLLQAVADELGERSQRLEEHGCLRRSFDLELELGRVLDPAVHASSPHVPIDALLPDHSGCIMNDAGAHAPSRLLRSPAGKGSLVRKLADVRLPERFRDLEVLARGGMGVVYRAHDADLGRDVAIKVLAREHAADAEVTTRFMREARVSARLSGVPNVVTVFDVGGLDDQPFIVMAYLSGGSIQQRLAVEGPQPLGRTLAWLAQAARALDAAHDLGVVHRDVKPANLLLDGDDVVHVADFGLASAVGLRSLTGAGTVMGTAGYLAPEQALGRTAGAASDRYALGVVAFELMTGSRPFAAETWTAEAAAHVHAPVPSARERRDELPRELDAVFQQALAKDPSDRFESCAAFGSALRRALDESSGTTIRLEPAAWPRTKPGHASAMPVA